MKHRIRGVAKEVGSRTAENLVHHFAAGVNGHVAFLPRRCQRVGARLAADRPNKGA